MRTIPIGTCVQGQLFDTWMPAMTGKGFECYAVNFHMSYAGTDIESLGPRAKEAAAADGAFISALGYYCNALQYEEHEANLRRAIDAAPRFGAKVVSTFAGALEGQSVDAAVPRFQKVFSELAKRAEDKGVKLAIENCPMGGTWRNNTCNIGFNPRAWDRMFDAVPSDALGLEWEPAHQLAQLIDPVACLRKYAKKIVHMHGKDACVRKDLIESQGVIGPEEPVLSRFPGLGDTDWRKLFAILHESGYEGAVSIEGYHDPFFAGDWEMTGQKHALSYLKWCRGGEYVPNGFQAL